MKKLKFKLAGLLISTTVVSQTLDEQYRDDVKSIDAIIDAYYEVISDSSNDPWQFERDKYLHSENVVIFRLDDNGKAEVHSLEAEYIPMGLNPREDFYEQELKRIVNKNDDMAQVWSAFEIGVKLETPSAIKEQNSIQLHNKIEKWYVNKQTVQMKS